MNRKKIVTTLLLFGLSLLTAGNAFGAAPDPNDPNLILWLDANDTSTFTFNAGSQVNTWADKSLGGRTATISGGASITRGAGLNGTSTVNFVGSDFMTLSSDLVFSITDADNASLTGATGPHGRARHAA